MQSLLILGRQPELGLAELESLYGSDKLERISSQSVIVDVDPCLLAFKRLGGSTKFAKLLTSLETTNWKEVERFLVEISPNQVLNMPPGKMNLGLSLYNFDVPISEINKSALNIKRAIQKTGRNVRIIPNKASELNTAQVIHNKLTSNHSWELLIIRSKNKTYIAQTIMVQDIDAYTKRDQVRPYRDSRVGMLPPKLAQIIINLAVGNLKEEQLQNICEVDEDDHTIRKLNQVILDPFCGTGVVLQEAALMGYTVIGNDLNSKMVDFSKNNMQWLNNNFHTDVSTDSISLGDATTQSWPYFDFVATETNLGKPLTILPSSNELDKIVDEANILVERTLLNIAKQTKVGSRICIAVPAWQTSPNRFKSLTIIDLLTDLGYNSMEFKLISNKPLIYYRPEQLVARQLLTLVRK